jgi:hypothetical protein
MKQSENLIGAFPHGSSLKTNAECGMMSDELKAQAASPSSLIIPHSSFLRG